MTKKPESRPAWDFATSEDLVRWLMENRVKKIEAHSREIGPRKSDSWVTLTSTTGETRDVREKSLGATWMDAGASGERLHLNLTLFHWNTVLEPDRYQFERMKKRVEEIDAYDKKHAKDIAEYRRLREQFGDIK